VRGIIGFDKGLRIDDIVDGTSNTIMVGEVTDGGPWFAGGVGTARRIDDWFENKTWSNHPGGGNFVFADGSLRFLSSNTDLQTLRHLATARGIDEIDDEDFGAEAATGAAPVTDPEAALPPSLAEGEEQAERLTLPSTTPRDEPSPQVPRQPRIRRGERARLSLRVALETHGGRVIRFRREGGPGELVLGLQDRTSAHTSQWLIVAAALLAAWICRRAPGSRRAIAVVVGLAVPIGLSGLVPLAWTPLLDGLLLGALFAGCLWILQRIIAAIKTRVPAATAAAVAIGISSLITTHASAAEEARIAGRPQASTGQVRQPNLTLFIPYDPDNDKPLENTQVYLPHDEFLRLWKQAHPEKPDHVPPEVRAIVSHAEYSGQLQNDVARFDGRLLIHHLDDQWVRVALPLGKVALEKVEINGRPATLANDDRAGSQRRTQLPAEEAAQSRREISPAAGVQPAIYLEEPGSHVVDVRFSVPVSRLGATGQMRVSLRAVPSGRLLFQLPAEDLDVQVSGCPGGWRRQVLVSGDKGTANLTGARRSDEASEQGAAVETMGEFVSIPLGATNELSIRWQPQRVEARAGQLISVDQALLIEVLDSGVHLHGKFHYRIQQGALSEVQLRIPLDMDVQRVDGVEVADWSIETDPATAPNPGARRLVVSLKTELTTSTDLDVLCFRRDRQVVGTIDVHALEPLGVVRETGRMAIGCPSHFRVRVDETNRVDQINHMGLDLPRRPHDSCTLISAYRYTSRPWRLRLQVERHRPRVEVSDRTVVAVTARQANLRSLLTAHVTGAPISSFRLRLPASLRVSQVRVPPGADWFIDHDDQGQQLKVDLNEPADGKLNFAVTGPLVRDSSQAEFVVPGVTVEEVQAHRGQLAIYLDDDLEAVLTSDSGARPIDPAALDSVLRPDGSRPVHYAFQYESPPKDLRLRLARAPSRLNGDVMTVVSVREGAVAYISQVDFEIRQAGRSRFRVVTPEWLGDDIELEGEQVRQIRSQVTDDGRTWDIELQQPVRGTYRLQLIQTLPLPDDGTVPAAIIWPLDVERSRSHVVLENLTADEIAATTISGVAPISIAAVPEGLTENMRRQAVAAYRIADDAAVLVWQRRVREQETGLKASINLADLTTVIHADGRYRARAAYSIRNFTLQFLELELPSDSQVWSVHVSGQPVRPAKIRRQGRPVTLLPLEKTSAGDFSSKVVVIYSGHLGEPLHHWTQVRPPAPQILSDVPVSRTLWTLLLPREYKVSLVKRESNLEEVAAAYQQEERKLSFLDELWQMVQVAGTKGKSGARTKARDNLMQVGSALQDYAQQSAQVDARNAADVQEQAQQIEAEIKRLEELKTDAKRADGDTNFYFKQPRRRPEDVRKKLQDQVGGRPEQQRGRLREQAAEQLERLQTMQQEERIQQKKAAPQQPSELPEGKQEAETVDLLPAVDERTGVQAPADGQAAPGAPMAEARTGYLSLDLDLALVGTAYHFRKLHGEPRLVLSARHENLSRCLSAIVWAGLCLALATAAICGLRRPNAAALASRGWPWLAAVTGTAWLFLLPAGVFGLALLVTALCVLIARSRKRQTTDSEISNIEQGVS
jgi:prepilin-type processing-associated H-X9-DG protein